MLGIKKWALHLSLAATALLGSGCPTPEDIVDEAFGPGICETQVCDFGIHVRFGHPTRLSISGSREGTLQIGEETIEFTCDARGNGSGDGYACGETSVRVLNVARDRPATAWLSVEFPDENMGFDGMIDITYFDNCGGACVGGTTGAMVEALGPLPGICEMRTDAGCTEALCRGARESCGIQVPWAPNYSLCEEATGLPVEDWSHCVDGCAQHGAGKTLDCVDIWADRCDADEAAAFYEVRVACTCETERTPDQKACAQDCIAARLACDTACATGSMVECLDCSAGCAETMMACAADCTGT